MKKNILVIDDDLDMRNILKKNLEEGGYGVFVSGDDAGAFSLLSRNNISLVLVDLVLKDTSGFEVCEKLRGGPHAGLPIIALSVSRRDEDVIRAIKCGANDFMEKPLDYRVLTAKIDSMLKLKEEEEELRLKGEELVRLMDSASLNREMLAQEADFTQDLNQFLDAELKKAFIGESFSTFLGARLFTIFTIDEGEREFRLFVSNHKDMPQNFVVPIDKKSVMYEVLKTKKPLFIDDFSASRYRKGKREKYKSNEVCVVPLISADKTIGVLNVNDPGLEEMEHIDFEGRIVRISKHLAVSIHNTILYEKVKDLSMRDSMTGLYNFRHFVETLRLEIEKARRYDEHLSCIMLDIDDFKIVNDTYGHQVGDLVLRELARSVSLSVRSSDIPARYGGDEFIIVLPKTPKKRALKIARRLLDLFSGREIRVPSEKQVIAVTLSIGIAGYPVDTKSMDELMKLADDSLYRAKKDGKNRIVVH